MQEEINIYNPLWYKDPNPIMLEKYLFELNHHPEYLINPQYQQEHAKYLLLYIRHTTGVFLRSLDPQKYKNLYPIERFTTKPYKNLICLEAQLWGKIWQALLNLEPEYRHSETPAKIFHHIIQEAKLVLLISCPANIDRIPSVEDFPETFRFIGLLMNLAQRDNEFNNKYYKKIIFSRRDLQGFLEDHNPQRYLTNPYTKQLEKYHKRTPKRVSKTPENPSK